MHKIGGQSTLLINCLFRLLIFGCQVIFWSLSDVCQGAHLSLLVVVSLGDQKAVSPIYYCQEIVTILSIMKKICFSFSFCFRSYLLLL